MRGVSCRLHPHSRRLTRPWLFAEEITGIDIVAAQLQISGGATLEQLGLTQDRISTRGYAIQSRITTGQFPVALTFT